MSIRQHTKLTDQQVYEIRQNYIPYSKDYSFRAFARKFKVDPGTIRAAFNFKSWKGYRRPRTKLTTQQEGIR